MGDGPVKQMRHLVRTGRFVTNIDGFEGVEYDYAYDEGDERVPSILLSHELVEDMDWPNEITVTVEIGHTIGMGDEVDAAEE